MAKNSLSALAVSEDLENFESNTEDQSEYPREIIVDLQLASDVSQLTKPLLGLLAPPADSRDRISRLIAIANGKEEDPYSLERLPVISRLSEADKQLVLDAVHAKRYAQRITELVVPLLFYSSGSDVCSLMESVFASSFHSDPIACSLAGAWLLREQHTPAVHALIAERSFEGSYAEAWYGTRKVHGLPLFVKGLLHSEDPIAIAIAASSCDARVGHYYHQNKFPKQSLLMTLGQLITEKIGRIRVHSLEAQAYEVMRTLLSVPAHPVLERVMVRALAASGQEVNRCYLRAQLDSNTGFFSNSDIIGGRRKFEIRQALNLAEPE